VKKCLCSKVYLMHLHSQNRPQYHSPDTWKKPRLRFFWVSKTVKFILLSAAFQETHLKRVRWQDIMTP
jgi:hypothetical protein